MDCAEMGESEERAGIRRISRDSTGAVRMPIWNTTIMCLAFFWGLCRVSSTPRRLETGLTLKARVYR